MALDVAPRRFRGRAGACPPVAAGAFNGRLTGRWPASTVGKVCVAIAAEANRPLADRVTFVGGGRRARAGVGRLPGRSKSLSMSDDDAALLGERGWAVGVAGVTASCMTSSRIGAVGVGGRVVSEWPLGRLDDDDDDRVALPLPAAAVPVGVVRRPEPPGVGVADVRVDGEVVLAVGRLVDEDEDAVGLLLLVTAGCGGWVFRPEPPRGLDPVGGNTSAIMSAYWGMLAASDDADSIDGLLGLAKATWWIGVGTRGA